MRADKDRNLPSFLRTILGHPLSEIEWHPVGRLKTAAEVAEVNFLRARARANGKKIREDWARWKAELLERMKETEKLIDADYETLSPSARSEVESIWRASFEAEWKSHHSARKS